MDISVSHQPGKPADRSSCVLRLASGRRIGYAEYGAPGGHPVIALHGTPGSRYMFALIDEGARARGLRVIAPERPGYGLSDAHRFEALSETADDIEALADALDLDRVVLIGVSGGGPHAVAAAALLRQRVLRMALVGPVGPTDGEHVHMSHLHQFIFNYLAPSHHAAGAFFLGLRAMLDWAPGTAYHLLLQRVTDTDRDVLVTPEVRANLQATLREGLRHSVEGPLQDLRLYCGAWNLSLGEIDTPTILWQGSKDTVVPPQAAYSLARTLPNCRLEVIEEAGHYWIFGAFDRVLDSIRAAWR